jgi:ligand-binding sensor domain-containing protein
LGVSWIRIDSGFIDQRINQIVNSTNGKVYAIQDSSIYFSQNDGDDWIPINNLPAGRIWDLDCDFLNNLYLTINVSGVSVAIGYRSNDNGISWQQFGSSCPILFWSINISPDGSLFTQGQFGIYKSTDKGETWNLISALTETTCMSFYSNDYLFSGSYSGVRKSINGGVDWQLVGLPNSYPQILSLAVDSIGNVFAGTGGNLPEVFRSTNHGQIWLNISGQFLGTSISTLSIDNNGNLFAGSYGGGIYYSSDYGVSWEQRNSGLSSLSISGINLDHLGNVYTGTWDGQIFRSSNFGNQWIHCDVGTMLILVDDIAIAPSGNIYIGTNDGIFVSNNHGLSWTHLNHNWPAFSQSLSVAVNNQENIFADASGHGVYRSTDFGNNWILLSSDISSPILDISINSLGNIFAAGANGVFRSTNNGEDWSLYNSGLPEWNGVNALVQDVDGRMIAATPNQGVCWTTSSTTAIQEVNNIVKYFALSQNYPNPFNPTTKIEYSIPKSLFVTFRIYDILGREVATVVNEEKPAGNYEIEFMGKGLPSGIYFYRLSAGDFVETKKMILLR